jgi:hypothetical protein
MVSEGLVEGGWDAEVVVPLDGVDSALLDCLDDNLAVLLRHAGVADVRAPFGHQWHFERAAGDGEPVVRREPSTASIARWTGWAAASVDLDPEAWPVAAAEYLVSGRGRPLLLGGDAFHLPWLPYAGHAHQEHSFVIEAVDTARGRVRVVDAYANKTQWGEAVPLRTVVSASDVEAAVGQWRALVLDGPRVPDPPEPDAVLDANAEAMAGDGAAALISYADDHEARTRDLESFELFVLGCWTLARSRGLHALWLADVGPADIAAAFAADVVPLWRQATEMAYVGWRRASRGKAPATSSFDLVRQAALRERALALQLAGRH